MLDLPPDMGVTKVKRPRARFGEGSEGAEPGKQGEGQVSGHRENSIWYPMPTGVRRAPAPKNTLKRSGPVRQMHEWT